MHIKVPAAIPAGAFASSVFAAFFAVAAFAQGDPSDPENLTGVAVAGEQTLSFDWSASVSPDSVASPVIGNVFRLVASGNSSLPGTRDFKIPDGASFVDRTTATQTGANRIAYSYVTGNTPNLQVTGLEEGACYHASVAAVFQTGGNFARTGFSNEIAAQTDAPAAEITPPGAPVLDAVGGEVALSFNWSAATSTAADGTIKGYIVQLREAGQDWGENENANSVPAGVAASGREVTIRCFDTKYIAAENVIGDGEHNTAVEFTAVTAATLYEARVRMIDAHNNKSAWSHLARQWSPESDGGTIMTRSADATLSALTAADGDDAALALIPEFSAQHEEYSAAVAMDQNTLNITATRMHADASLDARINGAAADISNSAALSVSVAAGITEVEIIVTAPNLIATKTYTIAIYHSIPLPPALQPVTAAIRAADLQWTPAAAPMMSDAVITEYRARWAFSDAPGVYLNSGGGDGDVIPGGASATAHSVTGLIGGATYLIQVAAISAAGTGGWSAAQTVTTLFSAAEARLASLAISAGELSPPFDAREVRYELTLQPALTLLTFTPMVSVIGAAVTVNDTEISADSPAIDITPDSGVGVITITVTSQDGRSMRIYTVRTIRETPPRIPVVIAAVGGHNEILVSWEADLAAHPPITTYSLRHRVKSPRGEWLNLNGEEDEDGTAKPYTGDKNWVTLRANNGVEYEVQIRATSALGTSAWSDALSVTPVANAESLSLTTPPNRLNLSIRSQSITATWDGLTRYEGYRIRWRESRDGAMWQAESGADDDGEFIAGGGDATYTITGLANETEYLVQVASVFDGAATVFGAAGRATPTDRPSPPGAIDSADITLFAADTTAVVAVWDSPPDDGGGDIFKYRLRACPVLADESCGAWNDAGGIPTGAGSLTGTVTGLTANSKYEVQIAAVNSAGTGAWSSSLTITTLANPRTFDLGSDLVSLIITDAADATATAITLTPEFSSRTIFYSAQVAANVENLRISGVKQQDFTSTPLLLLSDSASVALPTTVSIAAGNNIFTITNRALGSQGLTIYVLDILRRATPPALSPPVVTAASETSLDVEWSAPPTGAETITAYHLRWRTSAIIGDNAQDAGEWQDTAGDNPQGEELPSTDVAYTLTDLAENFSYDVQVAAANTFGIGDFSDSTAAVPLSHNPALATLRVTADAGETALHPQFSDAVATYQAYFSRAATQARIHLTTVNAGASVSVNGTAADPAGNDVALTTGGIAEIELISTAANAADTRTYLVFANHLPVPPRDFALAISAANTPTTIAASWSSGVTTYANAANLQLKLSGDSWPSPDPAADLLPSGTMLEGGIILQDGAFSALISGVCPANDYDVRVVGVYTGGDPEPEVRGEFSETLSVTTHAAGSRTLGMPQSVAITPQDGALSLTWSPPPGPLGAIPPTYKIRWALAPDPGDLTTIWLNTGGAGGQDIGGGNSYEITGLTVGEEYAVQTAAEHHCGLSAFSAAQFAQAGEGGGVTMQVGSLLDASENNITDWRDGILIARYLLGFRGDDLTAGATILEIANTTAADIERVIGGLVSNESLDVNRADGEDAAVTAADGILIARYLLGVQSGDALTAGQSDEMSDAVKEKIEALLAVPVLSQ